MNCKHAIWLTIMGLSLAEAQEYPIGPVIEPDSSEIILKNGDNYTIYCHGRSQVSWVRQVVLLDNYGNEGGFYMDTFTVESEDIEYPYKVALQLVNVNEHAVGYYACRQDNATVHLLDLVEEPTPTADVTYIYVYVSGTRSPFADMKSSISVSDNTVFAVPCRPTAPDVKLIISVVGQQQPLENDTFNLNPRLGFVIKNGVDGGVAYICRTAVPRNQTVYVWVSPKDEDKPPPNLFGPTRGPSHVNEDRVLLGGTLWLNCTVERKDQMPVSLTWTIPNEQAQEEGRYFEEDNMDEDIPLHTHYYRKFELRNVTLDDAGPYTCTVNFPSSDNHTTFNIKVINQSVLAMSVLGGPRAVQIKASGSQARWRINLYEPNNAEQYPYPYPNFTFWKNGKEEIFPSDGTLSKYKVEKKYRFITFDINNTTLEDNGNYTIVADNGYLRENVTVEARIEEKPTVILRVSSSRRYLIGTRTSFRCIATGSPRPSVKWIFRTTSCGDKVQCEEELKAAYEEVSRLYPYKVISTLDLTARTSGNLTCVAQNTDSQKRNWEEKQHIEYLVYEVSDGFGIESKDVWFPKNSEVVLTCVASVYDYTEGVTWSRGNRKKINTNEMSISYSTRNNLSYVSNLRIKKAALEHQGRYSCQAIKINDSMPADVHIDITVDDFRAPVFAEGGLSNDYREVKEYKPLNLNCTVDAVPPPTIVWYKDNIQIKNTTNKTYVLKTRRPSHSSIESVLILESVEESDVGKYACKAWTSEHGEIEKFVEIAIQIRDNKAKYYSIIGVLVVFFLLLICYLVWKIKKEKKLRKELALAGLLYFKEGNTKGLNPKLGIDQQADLLPYKEEFEFSEENLKLGKLLGQGAFGEVFKAEARGIIDAETSTTVAVKMVKKDADNMYIKALASELKIMVHMGKHLNIVNLLGACTKNVSKRQLMVIVEYCKFGNIHHYINKHRHVFKDQLTDNKDKFSGQVNRGFSSSANSGNHSDYLGTDQTAVTGHTMLHTGASSATRTAGNCDQLELVEFEKGSQSDYVQPKWRSNYTSEYSIDADSMRPLTSRDLICWAYQIACGMEYLTRRKVLHGDLAARNILLAEDNVVKICDFGLARSIQQNDNYQKQGDGPLPIKWLALECMTHKVFSTQSDVWSYGVVLWEMFSLGRTPYPAVDVRDVLTYLSSGHRLEKPRYANDALYAVMWDCWLEKPASRPSFNTLQQRIGSMLEDNVRNYYVELNNPYLESNQARNTEGNQDYLAMINSPDYHNTVTPSPKYHNQEMFFPPEPQTDQDGYLQMSPNNHKIIFSPRLESGEVFSYDTNKHQQKTNAASEHGVHNELTPMLTLNNQPQRGGSDSDHEASHSPYLPMEPHTTVIDEEDDSVFHVEDVIRERSQNLKNNSAAVTNPTYNILDMEKTEKNDKYMKVKEKLNKERPGNEYMNVISNSLVK